MDGQRDNDAANGLNEFKVHKKRRPGMDLLPSLPPLRGEVLVTLDDPVIMIAVGCLVRSLSTLPCATSPAITETATRRKGEKL